MGQLSRFLGICTLLTASSLYSDTIESRSEDIDTQDIQALREWINTKRQVTVKEIGGALSLSGEVRTEFQKTNEVLNGIKQRGQGGATPLNTSAFDVEVNLMLDYRADRTWAAIKLEFDNDAGIFGGSLGKIKTEKAYFGVRVIDQDTYSFDIEVGRRKMGTILDSKLEFSAFFDGAWFKYDHGFKDIGALYLHVGAFIINERQNHYGYVGEMGMLDILNSGFYTKYSCIAWDTKRYENRIREERFDFLISQLILGYKFIPKPLNKVVIIYLGGLYNHNAKPIAISDFKKSNFGGYLGFSMGELKKKGDWAMDVNYQVLAAQAVPDFDVGGIGFSNAANLGFYTVDVNGTGGPTTRRTAAGNGNFRGFSLTLDYLITSNLMFEQQWQQAVTLDTDIGPFRRFKQYEIEFIYGF